MLLFLLQDANDAYWILIATHAYLSWLFVCRLQQIKWCWTHYSRILKQEKRWRICHDFLVNSGNWFITFLSALIFGLKVIIRSCIVISSSYCWNADLIHYIYFLIDVFHPTILKKNAIYLTTVNLSLKILMLIMFSWFSYITMLHGKAYKLHDTCTALVKLRWKWAPSYYRAAIVYCFSDSETSVGFHSPHCLCFICNCILW